jgi:transposase
VQIAIVATARKLVCLCRTMIERGEDYAFARPSLTDKKRRALELTAADTRMALTLGRTRS